MQSLLLKEVQHGFFSESETFQRAWLSDQFVTGASVVRYLDLVMVGESADLLNEFVCFPVAQAKIV
jgi:hypothetical protein